MTYVYIYVYVYIYIIYYICKKTINNRQKNMIVESQADLGQQIQVHGDPWDPHGTHGKVVERSNQLMIFYGNQWEFVLLCIAIRMGYLFESI